MRALTWRDDQHLTVGNANFLVTVDPDVYLTKESTADEFIMLKVPTMVEWMRDALASESYRRIVDIGIYKGGSVAFLHELCQPERLTALDTITEPVTALTEFSERHGVTDVIRPRYGFDQGDKAALLEVLREDHGDERLDLVVDDASHLYAPTRASFEVLFPRLRPGGKYIIEDWGWAHAPGSLSGDNNDYFAGQPALTNLVIEFMMTSAGLDLIGAVTVFGPYCEVRRGGHPSTEPIQLEDWYLNRGKPFEPIL